MKTSIGLWAALLLLPMAASAHEDTCTERSEALKHIEYVHTAIGDAGLLDKKGWERDRLQSKAMAADAYVKEHKYADAIGKLDDIVTKVTSLLEAKKAKIVEADGENILDLTFDAMFCVSELQ